jgi:glycosyltransferase involved in cell wall biosynthesis
MTQPAEPAPPRAAGTPDIHVAVVGMSISEVCGVRDHATLLAEDLRERGVTCTMHWLQREPAGLRASHAQVAAFVRRLRGELASERPHAILVHYSVFAYSYKGLPVFVRPVFSALRRARLPVIAILHEFAYPWRYGGWRGAVWAVTQRALMREVMRTADAAVVTADWRVQWLQSRRWLPSRTVVLAPVFSNLPPPAPAAPRAGSGASIGLFGYAYEGAAVSLILDALAGLAGRGIEVSVRLLGQPGPESAAGAGWIDGAREHGLERSISFSGRLPAQELSDAIAACDLLVFADTAGPSGRKGTLAGALASGRPVVAIDGHATWRALVDAGAVRVVRADPAALADALAGLLGDRDALEMLGAAGRQFYEREMALARTTAAVLELLPAPRSALQAEPACS